MRRGRGKAFDFAGALELPPMRENLLPVIVQFLLIRRANDRQNRFPTHRHLVHDFLKSAIRANVLWLQRTCAGLKVERGDRRKANRAQQQQKRTRKNQHGRGFADGPAHILSRNIEEPVMANWRLSFANKQKQNRAHEQAGDENPNRNEHTELGKTHGATQHQGEKTHRRRKRTEENRPSKFCYRRGNGLLVWFSVGARLVIASDGENCEIDAEPDKNGAEAHADHTKPPEKKLAGCERNQTSEEKAKRRAHERQPSAKTCKENRAYQHD